MSLYSEEAWRDRFNEAVEAADPNEPVEQTFRAAYEKLAAEVAAAKARQQESEVVDWKTGRPVGSAEVSPREHVLRTAEKLVMGDRNNQYGPPTQDFTRTAEMLNAMGYAHAGVDGPMRDLKGSDVARILSAVKLSRSVWSSKEDNWIDLAGYAACAWENEVEENR